MTSTITADVWAELERFMSMWMKKEQAMSSWIAEVRAITFHLTMSDVAVDNEDLILVLTMGHPPSYKNLVIALDSTPANIFTIDFIIGCLLNEESCQFAHSTTSTRAVCTATRSRLSSNEAMIVAPAAQPACCGLTHITCFHCSVKGHFQANCLTPLPAAPATTPEVAALIVEEFDDKDDRWF
ncbi:hypothetical protein OE88DRAFT_1738300 [Heliocybe sulcata]|uniref:CCHC-type domain-containing protein n=1 Tax=Heliocybe sulcata TaxID=5364 RepID=A0A5C3MVJ6_9AGAM|nr:hypothetical protein OE88DRAFT_1738300 [Heliocybe sulcata]